MTLPSPTVAQATRTLAVQRWRIAATLTVLMVCVYFGFIALVAYDAPLLATLVHEGLSLGIVLGALVIVSAWVLTFVYVSWANRVYDPALAALRAQHAAHDAAAHDAANSTGAR
jgi:uncharacterized membrane protein (DUF485 family)